MSALFQLPPLSRLERIKPYAPLPHGVPSAGSRKAVCGITPMARFTSGGSPSGPQISVIRPRACGRIRRSSRRFVTPLPNAWPTLMNKVSAKGSTCLDSFDIHCKCLPQRGLVSLRIPCGFVFAAQTRRFIFLPKIG